MQDRAKVSAQGYVVHVLLLKSYNIIIQQYVILQLKGRNRVVKTVKKDRQILVIIKY